MFEIEEVTGIGGYQVEESFDDEKRLLEKVFKVKSDDGEAGKVFLVLHFATDGTVKTAEVRTDGNLAKTLEEDYESVMESRYFGRGGIEIVMTGQLDITEVYDLVRLSYNLSVEAN